MNINAIKTITIRAKTEGVGTASGELDKLAGSYDGVAKSAQTTATVTDQTAKRTLSVADAYKRQSSRIDETVRSQERISRETKIADNALREGLVTQAEHADRLNLIQTRYNNVIVATDKFGKSTGLARHELINLSRQAQDVGVSLASGQSPFTVLVQQGSQIADVFASSTATVGSFFSQAGGWAARFVTSAAGIATGMVGIGAGALYAAASWQTGQRDIERALIGIGKQSGVTIKDINNIASSSATTFGLSVDQARDAALEFVKTGAIYKDNIKAATDATYNFSIVTGQSAKEAAQELAKSLASPLEGADALNAKLGFLDGRTREYIATLVSQNQKQEAQAVLLRNLAPAIQEATNTLGPFEKAWNAVANAASSAKNAIGAALTPRTDTQQRDAIAESLNQRTGAPAGAPPALAAQASRFTGGSNRRDLQELERLNELLRETARARALAFSGDIKISADADKAVRELLPYIDQLKKVEEQLNNIKAAQASSGAQDRQGLSGSNEAAVRAAEVLKINLQDAANATNIANTYALQLKATYGGMSLDTAKIVDGLRAQIPVASAVTGQQAIQAQYQQTIATAASRGQTIAEATAQAEAQRAVATAQVNAQVMQQANSLNQQTEMVYARLNGTEDTVAAEQAYKNAIDAGAGSMQASAAAEAARANVVAQKEVAAIERVRNARAQAEQQAVQRLEQANASVEEQLYNNQKQIDLLNIRASGEEESVRAAHAYNDALRAGADLLHAQAAAESALALARAQAAKEEHERARSAANAAAQAAGGDTRNVGKYGYANTVATPTAIIGAQLYGPGGIDPQTGAPNTQGMQFYFDKLLQGAGGDFTSVIGGLLSGGLMTAGGIGVKPTLDTDKVNLLNRAIEVLPESQRAGYIQQEISSLSAGPASLETSELISQLNQKLEQLKQATEDNTSATQSMTDVLSPLYSSDPRTSRVGFRAFAGGGIMTPWGEVPLHKYDGGGIANTPQMAMFGEGSTPEAYVPVPSGRIPVEIKQPANSNEPRVTFNVRVSMTGKVTGDEARRTGFQIAQAANRALGR